MNVKGKWKRRTRADTDLDVDTDSDSDLDTDSGYKERVITMLPWCATGIMDTFPQLQDGMSKYEDNINLI